MRLANRVSLASTSRMLVKDPNAENSSDRVCATEAVFGKPSQSNHGRYQSFPFQEDSNLTRMLTRQCLAQQMQNGQWCRAGCRFQMSLRCVTLQSASCAYLNLLDDSNRKLTAAKEGLLLWHHRFGNAELSYGTAPSCTATGRVYAADYQAD
jgi:hypothetical protein